MKSEMADRENREDGQDSKDGEDRENRDDGRKDSEDRDDGKACQNWQKDVDLQGLQQDRFVLFNIHILNTEFSLDEIVQKYKKNN